MTVSTTSTGVVYEVSPPVTGAEYPIDFPYLHERDVRAYYALDNAETELVYGTDYEVSGRALIPLSEYPPGAKLAIYRETPLTQEILWVDGQAVYPPAIMAGDDKLTMIVQELAANVDRAVKVPRESADTTTPEDLVEGIFAARDQAGASAGAASAAASAADASVIDAGEQAGRAQSEAERAGLLAAEAAQEAQNAAFDAERARQWAQNPEGTPVITGQYSAFHWAMKALENAASGLRLSDALDGTRTAADGVSASEWALARVNEKVEGLVTVPAGVIVLWSGSAGNVPDEWALCDGENGTPDLRGRFIVGAGGDYSTGDSGGAQTHTHDMSGSVGATTLTAAQMPSHSHSIPAVSGWLNGTIYNPDINTGPSSTGWSTGGTGGSGSHTHTLESTIGDGNHMPPYYALCYIMKL